MHTNLLMPAGQSLVATFPAASVIHNIQNLYRNQKCDTMNVIKLVSIQEARSIQY